jgi:UDP-N-acetylglucosamine 2-epimerase (non-hydrolysing)
VGLFLNKKTIVCVVGTRPEAIKMAPVVLALRKEPNFNVKILATGQHSEMLIQALKYFNLTADLNLNIMKDCQTLDHITSTVITGVGKYFDQTMTDAVLVHGDTTTTFAASLAAFYRDIPIGHVEAGLRSGDIKLPFPEEMNRVLTDRIAKWGFAPTELAKENLIKEGMILDNIQVTGNTVIDALLYTVKKTTKPTTHELLNIPEDVPFLLFTAHRRESWGAPLENICSALSEILEKRTNLWLLVPMHKNPTVRNTIKKYLGDKKRAILCEPLSYQDFVWSMNASVFILSDSGGVQEEASALKKPVLILRDVTERPEAIENGSGILVGTNKKKILDSANRLLDDANYLLEIKRKCDSQPFGDGNASIKIASFLKKYFFNN